MKLIEITNIDWDSYDNDYDPDSDDFDSPDVLSRVRQMSSGPGDSIAAKPKKQKPLSKRKQRELNIATLHKFWNKDKLAEYNQLREHSGGFSNWSTAVSDVLGAFHHPSNRRKEQIEQISIMQPYLDRCRELDSDVREALDMVDLDKLRASLPKRDEAQREADVVLKKLNIDPRKSWYYKRGVP